ncbi:hypothetical protein [Rhizobium ruizarguesonis]|uniref:hypothetical protein n=1 Tax=Rhizobium ruizarguesonis TaxID=2081791 RepID=UPI0004828D24|nr:hypothetical protein [Rhizobium ruizarguesonis]QJS27171.1 hypothetical protein RLTA1_07610 [Rhizobium leguminosarum bv. trifolii TA1]UFW95911.1 hypothetical protein RlegTA1_07585 [Rhizobium ruizarguesonis]
MATSKQVCEILDDVMRLPPRTASWHAQRLRLAGLLPATQGIPEHISSEHVAAIILAIVTSSTMVDDYLELKPGTGGPTFGKVLAGFVDKPFDLLDLQIDSLAPGASVTFRGPDNGVSTLTFYSPSPKPKPAFDRDVRLGPEVFIKLAAAIATAPEVRAGRPRLRDRYSRR